MNKTLSLVIPVYNESARLSKTFGALTKTDIPWGIFTLEEIIFVNDGSKDNTAAIIKAERPQLQKLTNAKVRLISYKKNRGKGHAVKVGMLASKSDYTLMMDADMSTPMTELARFQYSARKNRPVIIGTRKSKVVRVEKEQPWLRRNLGRVFTLLSQISLNVWVTDFTCGFKMFNYQATQQIFNRSQIERWGYDSEILFLAKNLGYPIKEISVRWRNDERSRVNIIKDAWRSLTELGQIRYLQVAGRYNLRPRLYEATATFSVPSA
jgi:dolichyl-phosphate beta-glucosyltransferase